MFVPIASFIAIKLQKRHLQNCWKIPWMRAQNLKTCPMKDWDVSDKVRIFTNV